MPQPANKRRKHHELLRGPLAGINLLCALLAHVLVGTRKGFTSQSSSEGHWFGLACPMCIIGETGTNPTARRLRVKPSKAFSRVFAFWTSTATSPAVFHEIVSAVLSPWNEEASKLMSMYGSKVFDLSSRGNHIWLTSVFAQIIGGPHGCLHLLQSTFCIRRRAAAQWPRRTQKHHQKFELPTQSRFFLSQPESANVHQKAGR